MSEFLNAELFNVSITDRLRTGYGIGILRTENGVYLDPRVSPKSWTFPSSDPDKLKLRLSQALPPVIKEQIYSSETIENASLNSAILGLKRYADLARFRLFETVEKPLGKIALVGVSKRSSIGFGAIDRIEPGIKILHRYRTNSDFIPETTELALIPEGKSIVVGLDLGSYFSDYTTFRLSYSPDSEKGLEIKREGSDNFNPPYPPLPGDPSGDRVPRDPLPSKPTESMHLLLS